MNFDGKTFVLKICWNSCQLRLNFPSTFVCRFAHKEVNGTQRRPTSWMIDLRPPHLPGSAAVQQPEKLVGHLQSIHRKTKADCAHYFFNHSSFVLLMDRENVEKKSWFWTGRNATWVWRHHWSATELSRDAMWHLILRETFQPVINFGTKKFNIFKLKLRQKIFFWIRCQPW